MGCDIHLRVEMRKKVNPYSNDKHVWYNAGFKGEFRSRVYGMFARMANVRSYGDNYKIQFKPRGLPEDMNFELVEPVRILFKDEVRVVGKELGLPDNMVYRQPFPGPGLGVRCPGAITRDRLEAVRESDAILREEFEKNGLAGKVWQYFTVVPDFKSTGVKDGKRTFDWPCIIRAINTTDVMEVTVEHLSDELIDHLVNRIITEVPGINRVLFDYTPKPPATVEYE